jgi:4-alpha-glucanotransferase
MTFPKPLNSLPFPKTYRASGVLLHVTCLPSPYGIGDLGPSAFAWVDRLARAGQSWWQVLPLGPTGYGNSPYQSFSSFAGNPLLISPDRLVEDRLLQAGDVAGVSFPAHEVDFPAVAAIKIRLLDRAWANFQANARPDLRPAFDAFRQAQAAWLDDFALFAALKAKHGGVAYQQWPAELVRRERQALNRARKELAGAIDRVRFVQFVVSRQWQALKEHARSRGVSLLGDLPFYVSADSSDVWADPEFFLLDEQGKPQCVAGVPPDYFSPTGQLWGNPMYNWPALRKTGYRWWINRLRASLANLDLLRLDHFRAFEAAWYVPATATTAEHGEWRPGPGADFFRAVKQALGGLPLIAEDLGMITPPVRALRDQFNLPGMRVLQFAFDGMQDNPFLPHHYIPNTVAYTGTHDNDTTRGWYATLPGDQRRILLEYLKRPGLEAEEAPAVLLRLAWQSVAALAVVPLQDVLNLDASARMNRPGEAGGNWSWRVTEGMLEEGAFRRLLQLTEEAKRLPTVR